MIAWPPDRVGRRRCHTTRARASSQPGDSPRRDEAPGACAGQAGRMSDPTTLPETQLLLYRFGPNAAFEGQLVGALERMESGGALRIVDALFVRRDVETDEVSAIGLQSRGAGSLVAPMLGFRLDAGERRRATKRALGDDAVRALAGALAPGGALAAVLVEHVWSRALSDAVARMGGAAAGRDFVAAGGPPHVGHPPAAAGGPTPRL